MVPGHLLGYGVGIRMAVAPRAAALHQPSVFVSTRLRGIPRLRINPTGMERLP